MNEARFWRRRDDGRLECLLCGHRCVLKEGASGRCAVRFARGGRMYTRSYGALCSAGADPIEKKPLYHFMPGTATFSMATMGCNFSCRFCQNHSLSQAPRLVPDCFERFRDTPPGAAAELFRRSGCPSLTFTYSEPTIFWEYAADIVKELASESPAVCLVTNGFMSEEALAEMVEVVDAVNVDRKAFSEETYRKVIGGALEPVLRNIRLFHEAGVWVEVTTLVVTGLNDSEEELRSIAEFIRSISPSIPWHVSAYHPAYLYDAPPTTPQKVRLARKTGLEAGLRYVYTGNIPDAEGSSTWCWSCGALLVERLGYQVRLVGLDGVRCRECGAVQDFILDGGGSRGGVR